jgi:SpoVK/Ycf46/Vps4 family AAA+-type ATPase
MDMCDAMKPNSIALFEDIDRVGISEREITEASLLSAINEVGTRGEGRLLIAAANNRTRIPEAVLRRGRIDEE